jgi:hypothetical protein
MKAEPSEAAGPASFCYRLANRHFCSERALAALVAFTVSASDRGAVIRFGLGEPLDEPVSGRVVLNEPAWLGGGLRQVSCRHGEEAALITVAGVGQWVVANDGRAIWQVQRVAGSEPVETEAILGPALILALAQQGVWCLHASAVTFQGAMVAFAAESGGGKSTLAAYLGGQSGWRRAADDVLPVTPSQSGLVALPHFPQLKLPSDAQPGAALPESLPLAAVYLLDEAEEDGPEEVAIVPLSERDAAVGLIGATVATRLFSPQLMGRHTAFCAEAARQTPVRRLRYRRRWEQLPAIRDRLADELRPLRVGG